MTGSSQSAMNLGLALAIPTAGLVYLLVGVALPPNWSTIGVVVASAVLWLTATVVLNTIRRPRLQIAGRVQEAAGTDMPRRVVTPAYPIDVVDVSRPVKSWPLRSLLTSIELLVLAWGVPVLILLVMVPIGLALASARWVGRLILGP
jgi:hypothetical protein